MEKGRRSHREKNPAEAGFFRFCERDYRFEYFHGVAITKGWR